MGLARFRGWPVSTVVTAVVSLIGVPLLPVGRSAADSACATGVPDARPVGKGQQLIVDYFNAVNGQDYATAWGYLGRPMRARYGATSADRDADGLSRFSSTMRRDLQCVRVTGIASADRADPDVSASLGIQWHQVTFDVRYSMPRNTGAATLPPFYKTHADPHEPGAPPPLIIDEATAG